MSAAKIWPSMVAGIIASLPVWLVTFPPMVDLPQYAAQVAMFNQIIAGEWAYTDLFDVELFTPYLSAFMLIWLIEPLAGMVTAVKLVVCLTLFGLPVSAAVLVKEFDGDTRWSWLVVPASYGFAFNWGFLNFLVAAPLGLLYLAVVSRYARKPTLKFGLGLAALTHLLFFAHILPLFFFGVLGGALILLRARSIASALAGLLPLLSLAPMGLSWGLPSLGESQAQWPTIWDLRWSRLYDIPNLALGTGAHIRYGLIFLALLIIPLLGGARPTKKLERYAPVALCIMVLMLVPNLMLGNYFTYQRFAIFAIPLYLLILDRRESEDAIRYRALAEIGAIATAVAWVAVVSLRFHGYERESRDFRAIVGQMEPDQRVLSMVFMRNSQFSVAPIYLHYPVWYQAGNAGLVDFNFATFQGEPVHYRKGEMPSAGVNFVWRPYSFSWEQHRRFGYRYLLARAGVGSDNQPLIAKDCDQFALVSNVGAWWLYEVIADNQALTDCGQH